MVADGVAFVGGVGEAVLVAEVFVDFGVDFVECVFLEALKSWPPVSLEICSRIFGLPSGRCSLRVPSAAAAAAHPAASATHAESAGRPP